MLFRSIRRNAGLHFVENLTTRDISNENVFFVINRERRDRNMIYGFTEDGSECIFALGNQTRGAHVYDIDVKIIGGTPYLFSAGRIRGGGFFRSCNLTTMACNQNNFGRGLISSLMRMSVNNEGTIVYITDRRDGSIQGRRLVASNGALGLDAEVRRCDRADSIIQSHLKIEKLIK